MTQKNKFVKKVHTERSLFLAAFLNFANFVTLFLA